MINYLLDTHTLLWFLGSKANLSDAGRKAIENESSQCFCSIASLWEMTIKSSAGKLILPFTLETLSDYFYENGIKILPITVVDLRIYRGLVLYHKDPFDRMLIAQAISNDFILISKDPQFSQYPVKILW